MKKQKVSEFLKNKSFYLVLLTGLTAILVIAIVFVNIRSTDSGNGLVDLNERPNVASKDNTNKTVASNEKSKQQNSSTSNRQGNTKANSDYSLLENDIVSAPTKENSTKKETAKAETTKANQAKAAKAAKSTKEEKNNAAEAMSSAVSKLSFKEEEGLAWPIKGDIVLNYSMDHGVYFQTLGEYKCNPAILIGAKVGAKVESAADGIVTAIENNDETGVTITMDIGSDFTLQYGQLANVTVKVGDSVKTGDTLGAIAEPTKYYVVEGSNLYFKVINGKEPYNPMQLLNKD
ncbi:M23 family metallopeptidase [Anaeromicropila herbilytica]|uniref:M23ase beta-sheet core domain-containing protein n=1 Tax=Anaeromicropila herbilytica TaxID=2785025 RepID=A0A7R7IEM1_9FIRM|nr:M23 family metallopeptidase [Anaeromicropila herbilytica]BCN32853.1 hypothetical protein bsdtb5_41480 [Anaeromicropila herbilytica]